MTFSQLFSGDPASLKLRTRRTSGFALRATPPFAKIFDFVQNGSSWRVKSALLKFLAARSLDFASKFLFQEIFPLHLSLALAGFAHLRSLHPTEFRLLDFTSGSSRVTSFQKCKNALFPFRSAFTLAHYVRFHLTSVLRKIRLLDFVGASLFGTPLQIPYSRNFTLR